MPLSHVYDTFAKATSGRLMHFDVILDVQSQDMALHYAKAWLASIGYSDAVVTHEDCAFCQSAQMPVELRQQIDINGYAIFQLDGFPNRVNWLN